MPLTNHRPFFVVAMVAATAGVATLIIIAIRKRRAKHTDQQGASFAEVLKRQEVVVIEKIEDAKPILIRLISDTKKQRVITQFLKETDGNIQEVFPMKETSFLSLYCGCFILDTGTLLTA